MFQILKNILDNHVFIYWDKLRKAPNLENGLRHESNKVIQKRGDYIYGGFTLAGSKTIKEDGNFLPYIPEGEQQNRILQSGEDCMWCVNENGICNTVETLVNYFISLGDKADLEQKEIVKIFKHFGLIEGDKCRLSTEYNAIGSGTTKRGNSYQAGGQFARKYGFIPKGLYKWNYKNWNTLYYGGDTYINGNKLPGELLERGKALMEYIELTYEWYPPNSNIANERGIPGTSAGAWPYPDSENIYRPVGISFNHAIYRPKKNTEVKTIGDSYPPFVKLLSLDYPTGNDFLITLKVKKPITNYNKSEIDKLKNRGLDYVLLINKCGSYDPGVYKLAVDKLEKADLKVILDSGVEKLAKDKKLTGISAEDFKKLVNLF